MGQYQYHHRLRTERDTGPAAAPGGGAAGGRRTRRWRRRRRGGLGAIVVGGFGTGEVNNCAPARFGGGILFVDGFSTALRVNDVYAIDARDGTVLWHYYWKFRGGTTTGTRGPSMWHNYIYFELHDDWVVCLDAKTGNEVWKKEIAPFDQQYFSSNVPLVIGNHIIVGTGNDTDEPAYLQSARSGNGRRAVDVYSTAQNPGDPGLETWAASMPRGTAAARPGFPVRTIPTRISIIFGTGNPTPAYTQGRGDGDNLYTSCLLALNVDTGKMVWYFQTSPHDTHDWDSTQTPILADLPCSTDACASS